MLLNIPLKWNNTLKVLYKKKRGKVSQYSQDLFKHSFVYTNRKR